ncbi:caspase-3-like [Mercenaria mercenaria]|uniref:caspase-3-like n=1 Tax=Mercenaria mercenaria TaxID=6596 RepID=UPI00234F8A6E|nr:caspase-3-like [Mercenaria mercenaria]XP_045161199.2 caspase-3-like [Mercenaria mercenaria]
MMEQVHRKLLQRNRTTLIDNISNPIDVVEKLFEKNLFTEAMKQEVEAERTKNGQIRKILDTVPKRGPTAFNIFYVSLLETANDTAADILKPELQGTHPHHGGAGERGYAIPQPGVELPQDWPNVAAMTMEIKVLPCNVRSDLVRHNWISPNVYSMKKRCRGRCLILSNQTFYGPLEKDSKGVARCILPSRHGTVKDRDDLKVLFKQLHFDVITRNELTVQDFHSELLREAAHSDHNQAECFVCVICSHGTKTGIYGVDGGVIPLENVTKYFDGEHCKGLQSKPKLFFIQACQGETADRPGSNVVDGGQDLSNLLEKVHIADQTDAAKETSEQLDPNSVPTKTDMLVACATHPGYVSLRNTKYGSWFIQAVIYVFQKYACKEDIFGLLILVNSLVARGRTALDEKGPRDVMQASLFTASLTKKFLFFPGVVADSET